MLLSFITLLACNDEDSYDVYNTSQCFFVHDNEGNDLLDLDNQNRIDISKIKTYFLLDQSGKVIHSDEFYQNKVPHAILDQGDGKPSYFEWNGKKHYFFKIGLSEIPVKSDTTYTLIEWNQNGWKTDTIISKISQGASYLTVGMVMFNDSVWNTNHIPPSDLHNISDGEASFTIVKLQ
ncbi:MAG TPA: hypothetical protein DIT04_13330 [Dysgonomonas sp.]|nr:hypothetical protein [Dysgonomonas sp.]